MAVNSDHVPNGFGPGHTGQLCRELELAGVDLPSSVDSDGVPVSDVTLVVDARSSLASDVASAQLRQQVFDVLIKGLRLSASVCGLGEESDAHAAFSGVCKILRAATNDATASPDRVEIVVDAQVLAPQAAWRIRREQLGDGLIHLLPGQATMQAGESCHERRQHDLFWPQLWQVCTSRNVQTAFAPAVYSPCSLLSAEIATGILPDTAVQVPAGTAWLPMRMDISRFADAGGFLREGAVEHALCSCIDIGDLLHDSVDWPTARMRHDAWLNRRLAIILTGFGDLAQRRKQDPTFFASLKDQCELLSWIQDVLLQKSRAAARRTGNVPALEQTDPSRALPRGQIRNGWRTRWCEALEVAAIRHRNLLVLSPWSVFPANEPADFRYADLLPLLNYADAASFSRPPGLSHWGVSQFKTFHQRAWAVLQQRDVSRQIAERI